MNVALARPSHTDLESTLDPILDHAPDTSPDRGRASAIGMQMRSLESWAGLCYGLLVEHSIDRQSLTSAVDDHRYFASRIVIADQIAHDR